MKMKKENNNSLLIKIILSLLLALAFFSPYATGKEIINHMVLIIFLFGILSLTSLYIGISSNRNFSKNFFKFLGYIFAGSFILVFGYFILHSLALSQNITWWEELLTFPKKKTIYMPLFISLIILMSYTIINKIRE